MALTNDRERLVALDRCLAMLEDAHESGRSHVTADIAASLAELVPDIRAGTRIGDALNAVFAEQALCMRATDKVVPAEKATGVRELIDWETVLSGLGVQLGGVAPPGASGVRISHTDAERISSAVRQGTEFVSLTLLAAHDLGALRALGYDSWAEYVDVEFGMSRSRSYELLDQARVILAVREAAGLKEVPRVSAYVASELKKDLKAIVRAVRDEVSSNPELSGQIAIDKVVHDARQRLALSKARRHDLERDNETKRDRSHVGTTTRISPSLLIGAVRTISSATSSHEPGELLHIFQGMESDQLKEQLVAAANWLATLAQLLEHELKKMSDGSVASLMERPSRTSRIAAE